MNRFLFAALGALLAMGCHPPCIGSATPLPRVSGAFGDEGDAVVDAFSRASARFVTSDDTLEVIELPEVPRELELFQPAVGTTVTIDTWDDGGFEGSPIQPDVRVLQDGVDVLKIVPLHNQQPRSERIVASSSGAECASPSSADSIEGRIEIDSDTGDIAIDPGRSARLTKNGNPFVAQNLFSHFFACSFEPEVECGVGYLVLRRLVSDNDG